MITHTYDNPVPSLDGNIEDGCNEQDTRARTVYEVRTHMVKIRMVKRHGSFINSMMCSTPLINIGKPRVARRIKGIISNPMPKSWYQRKATEESEDTIDARIVVDKKPRFMIYRYEEEYKRYRNNKDKIHAKSLARFGMSLDDLKSLPDKTTEQEAYILEAEASSPVLNTNGLMNRLCNMVEDYFADKRNFYDGDVPFDCSILKSGRSYSNEVYYKVKSVYEEYLVAYQNNEKMCKLNRLDSNDVMEARKLLIERFQDECSRVCTNRNDLADILVDMCYKSNKSKQFVWQMVGDVLAEHVIQNAGGKLCYLKQSKRGTVEYGGNRFAVCYANYGGNSDTEDSFE